MKLNTRSKSNIKAFGGQKDSSDSSNFSDKMSAIAGMANTAIDLGVNAVNQAKIDSSAIKNDINSKSNLNINASNNDDLMNMWNNTSNIRRTSAYGVRGKTVGQDTKNIFKSTAEGAMAGSAAGPWGAVIGGVVGLGSSLAGTLVGRNKAKREADELNQKIAAENRRNQISFNNAANNLQSKMNLNAMSNISAFGGPLGFINSGPNSLDLMYQNTYNKQLDSLSKNKITSLPNSFQMPEFQSFADGGNMNKGWLSSNGADWSLGYNYIGAGGTHEQNPNQGVQVGVDPQGVPNKVEEGEMIFDDFVFSDRLKVPKELNKKYKLGKKPKSFASAMKKITEQYDDLPNDPIAQDTLAALVEEFKQSQEIVKQKKEMAAREELMSRLSPEDLNRLGAMQEEQQQAQMQEQAAQEQMMQQMMAQQGGMPQDDIPPEMMMHGGNTFMPQMMAYGGNLFGGNDPNQPSTMVKEYNVNDPVIPNTTLKITPMSDDDFVEYTKNNTDFDQKLMYDDPTYINQFKNAGIVFNDDNTVNWEETYKEGSKYMNKRNILLRDWDKKDDGSSIYKQYAMYKKMFLDQLSRLNKDVAYDWYSMPKSIAEKITLDGKLGAAHLIPDYNLTYAAMVKEIADKEAKSSANPANTKAAVYERFNKVSPNVKLVNGNSNAYGGNLFGFGTSSYQYDDLKRPFYEEYLDKYVPANTTNLNLADRLKELDYKNIWQNQFGIPSVPKMPSIPNTDRLERQLARADRRDQRYIDNIIAEEQNAWQNQFGNPDTPDDSLKYNSTWARYAPIAASALGLAASLQKPNPKYANDIERAANVAGTYNPVSFNPLGDYMSYDPLDRNYYLNKLTADSAATRNAILNASNGNASNAMANILAADYNNQIGIGNLARQAEEYNDNLRKTVAEFNRGTNQTNSQGILQANMANQQAMMNARQAKLQGVIQANQMRQAADAARQNAISNNLTSLATNLGNLGTEQYNKNDFWWKMANGMYGNVLVKPQNMSDDEWKKYQKLMGTSEFKQNVKDFSEQKIKSKPKKGEN